MVSDSTSYGFVFASARNPPYVARLCDDGATFLLFQLTQSLGFQGKGLEGDCKAEQEEGFSFFFGRSMWL